jgi:hypothetical protein
MEYRRERSTIEYLDDVESALKAGPGKENCFLCTVCKIKRSETRLRPCGHLLACWQCAPTVSQCEICKERIKCFDDGETEFNGNNIVGNYQRATEDSSGTPSDRVPRELSIEGNWIFCSFCKKAEAEVWMLPCNYHGACWSCASKVKICPTCPVLFVGFMTRRAPWLRSCPSNF